LQQNITKSPAEHRFVPIAFTTRFPALDGIRALAVTMVFATHYGGGAKSGWLLNLYNSLRLRGWMGVDLFFTLSGFLITGILYDTRNDSRFFARFFARRSVRIFPVFYLVVVILSMLTPIFHYEWRPGHLPFLIYMGNFLANFDQSLYEVVSANHPAASAHIGHLWSLCVEEQFYLLWPIVVWKVRDRDRLLWIACGMSFLALAFRGSLLLFSPELAHQLVYSLPFRMDALFMGAILALLLRGESSDSCQRACKWVFLGASSLVVAIFVLSPASDSSWLLSIGFTLIAAASAGLIGMTLRSGSPVFRLFHLRPLRTFGKYSYGFYLYHLIWPGAWAYWAGWLTIRLHSSTLGGAIMNVLNFVITFIVAKLSYDLFEIRFFHLKKRFEYDSELKSHKHAFTTR
jgi:peptidoglycan/LPS O-acetylase OafA/YrhL